MDFAYLPVRFQLWTTFETKCFVWSTMIGGVLIACLIAPSCPSTSSVYAQEAERTCIVTLYSFVYYEVGNVLY